MAFILAKRQMIFYYLCKSKFGITCMRIHRSSRESFLFTLEVLKEAYPTKDYIEIPTSCVHKIYGITRDQWPALWERPWPEVNK